MKKKALQIILLAISVITLILCFYLGTISRWYDMKELAVAASSLGVAIISGLSLVSLAIISK